MTVEWVDPDYDKFFDKMGRVTPCHGFEEKPTLKTPFKRAFNSSSGVDIKAMFGTEEIGVLQGISYSIHREPAPIYTMGTADPQFVRKRRIAGTLVPISFDVDKLIDLQVQPPLFLSEEIAPFDIIMVAANEYGALAKMKILGVNILHKDASRNATYKEVKDSCVETAFMYTAAGMIPWTLEETPKIPEEIKDEDDGMIVNPITGRKSWL